jgi:hypothetical protein
VGDSLGFELGLCFGADVLGAVDASFEGLRLDVAIGLSVGAGDLLGCIDRCVLGWVVG